MTIKKILKSLLIVVLIAALNLSGIFPKISQVSAAAPTFQAVGAAVSNTVAVSPVWPAHQANDIGIMVIETGGEGTTLTPSGWTHVSGSPIVDVASIAGSKLNILWKRAVSSSEAAVTTGDSGDHQVARIYTFRGVIQTGNPWDVVATGTKTVASTTATAVSVSTTVIDTLVLLIVGRPNDSSSTSHFGAFTNGNLTSITERGEGGTTSGHGGGFVLTTGGKATAGATGTSTSTKIASTTDTYMTIALKPADTTAPLPNPMTFATPPANDSTTQISMTATAASDDYSPPVNYLFTNDNSGCGVSVGSGGTSSSWQASTSYSDSGLQPNKCYGYTIQARDSAATPNVGTASNVTSTYTSANTPGTPSLGSATSSTLNLTNAENSNPSSNPTTNFAVQVTSTTPNDSNWINKWVDSSGNPSATEVWMTDLQLDSLVLQALVSSATYGVKVKARNQDNDETGLSTEGQDVTQAAPAISITSDGVISYGIVPPGTAKSTIQLTDTQTAKNDGSATENFNIKTSTATGGTPWTIGVSAGDNVFVHEFSTNSGTNWTKFADSTNYQTLATGVGVNSSIPFDLKITVPWTTSDFEQKNITVTIQAVSP